MPRGPSIPAAGCKVRSSRVLRYARWHLAAAILLSNWVALRDTAAGVVSEPGWCQATLRDEPARLATGWHVVLGERLPSGTPRRGWDVTAGSPRLDVLSKPRMIGRDSARVDYVLTVAPNANGVAIGAERDTVRHTAVLVREEGQWRLPVR